MLVSENHAMPRAMLIWVAGAATLNHGDVTVLPRAMSGSMALQRPGFVAPVATEGSVDAQDPANHLQAMLMPRGYPAALTMLI